MYQRSLIKAGCVSCELNTNWGWTLWPLWDPGWPLPQRGDVGRCSECCNSGKGICSNNMLFWEELNHTWIYLYYHGQECVRAKSTVGLETVIHFFYASYGPSSFIQLSFIWVISVSAHHRKTLCNGKQQKQMFLYGKIQQGPSPFWPVCFHLVPSKYDAVVSPAFENKAK